MSTRSTVNGVVGVTGFVVKRAFTAHREPAA